ncbi:protein of unknown function [Tenacibaculum sp. MAR_2009_124]|uniref:DUF4349 domain-containing protein n=1 Tax=Tenacibaculum sp. MAR_2009_124 TaxID=1250059 RepID=UPI00089C9A6B|nr:DUF4349 domain-containing protein [Tenacibaculum sp. MAR_2009_124]SEC77344.1 protein of unknown function [Tenacibaculum sp. MAR_2009_124]
MKKQLKKTIAYFIVGFLVLFVFRMIYGYTVVTNNGNVRSDFFNNISSVKKNYASEKYRVKSQSSSQIMKVDQKYEKIAEISSKTTDFVKDEKQVRLKIRDFSAIIQFEQKRGNSGNRRLNMLVGVFPEKFDTLYRDLMNIGKVQIKKITKKDKTNEYKQLNAKKASLEKIRQSLIDLKSKGGKIAEYMSLENRILEIEQQLQDLGVSLGDFDDENEFCTIQFSLMESKTKEISLIHRVKVSLEWTIKFYFTMIITLLMITFLGYLLLLIVDKLKIMEKIVKNN